MNPSLCVILAVWLTVGLAALTAVAVEVDFTRGNSLYAEAKFSEAAQAYQTQVLRGDLTANLYYNLANAEFCSGDPGRAILNYQRALLLDPSHAEAASNLAFVRGHLVSLNSRSNSLWLAVVKNTGVDNWTWIAAVSGWIALFGAVAAVRKRRGHPLAFAAILVGVPAFAVALAALFSLQDGTSNLAHAVVLVEGTRALYSPADNAKSIRSLPAGCEVRILLDQGAWMYVLLDDGERGWVTSNLIERVFPRAARSS